MYDWTDDARKLSDLTVNNTGCRGFCSQCGSTEIRVLNRFQEIPKAGYHVECNVCESFWDEYVPAKRKPILK